jgi:hypothetical protein
VPQPFPQPRIDTFVSDANTGAQMRCTEYSGTLWYGDPPQLGPVRAFTRRGIQDDTPVFLPDSLPYQRSELGGGTIACTVGIQAQTGESTHVIAAHADWADDPRGGDAAWIALRVTVAGYEPLAVSYRVVALCSTRAAPSDRVIKLR